MSLEYFKLLTFSHIATEIIPQACIYFKILFSIIKGKEKHSRNIRAGQAPTLPRCRFREARKLSRAQLCQYGTGSETADPPDFGR